MVAQGLTSEMNRRIGQILSNLQQANPNPISAQLKLWGEAEGTKTVSTHSSSLSPYPHPSESKLNLPILYFLQRKIPNSSY